MLDRSGMPTKAFPEAVPRIGFPGIDHTSRMIKQVSTFCANRDFLDGLLGQRCGADFVEGSRQCLTKDILDIDLVFAVPWTASGNGIDSRNDNHVVRAIPVYAARFPFVWCFVVAGEFAPLACVSLSRSHFPAASASCAGTALPNARILSVHDRGNV